MVRDMSVLEMSYTPAASPTLHEGAEFMQMCRALNKIQRIPIEDVHPDDITALEMSISAFMGIGTIDEYEEDELQERLRLLHRIRIFRQLIGERDWEDKRLC